MKLFLKHIFRDIRKFPIQPILIILTLVLSVSCAVTAFCSEKLFRDHAKALSGANEELGDIIVSAGSADTRILFVSDAEKAVGGSAKVIGDFKLTGSMKNGEFVSISATDLVAADRYFEFLYTKYGKFTEEDLGDSAIISKSFSEKNELDIGDTVTVSLLGKDRIYKVQAVAENTGLLSERDMLVSIDGLIGLLSEKVPSIAAVGSIITPYTRLLIKAETGSDVSDIMEKLKGVPEFSGYRIDSTDNSTQKEFLFLIQTGSVWMIAAIIILLAAILTGTALKLLESKRRLQYAAFTAAGASRSQIALLRYAESFIYSVLGAVLGIILSIPMTERIGSLFEWSTETLRVGIGGVIFGAFFSPVLILSCTAIHIRKLSDISLSEQLYSEEDRKTTGEKLSKKEVIILISLIILCLSAIPLLPVSKRYLPAFILLPLILRCIYIFIPPIITSVSNKLVSKLSSAKKCHGNSILIIRSFQNRFALKHVSRLAIILIALLFSVNLCRSALGGTMSTLENIVTADMAAIGAGKTVADDLKNDPQIESVARIGVFKGTELPAGYTLTSISLSGDIESCIDQALIPQKLPSGKEAVISSGIAKLCGVDVGESFTVKIKGTEYELTVSEILQTGIGALFIDADSLGLGSDAICFNFAESSKNDTAKKNELISTLEAKGVSTVEPKYLFGTTASTAKGFMALLEYATAAALVLAVAGCLNSLTSFYISRSKEFDILRLSGMTRAKLIGIIALEIISIAFIAIIFALPVCAALSGVIDTVMSSFGFSIFM